MNQVKDFPSSAPVAFIFCELDDLSFSICKKFIEKNCLVKIICEDTNNWKQAVEEGELKGVELEKNFNILRHLQPNYIIYHLNSFRVSENKLKKIAKEETKKILWITDISEASKTKTVFLFPANTEVKDWVGETAEKTATNIIFFDRTIGPYFRPLVNDPFGKMVRGALAGGVVDVPGAGSAFSLASSDKVAELVLRLLLSFGRWQEVYLSGPDTSYKDFFFTLKSLDDRLVIRESAGVSPASFLAKQRLVVEGPADEEILKALIPLRKQAYKGSVRKKFIDDTKKNILYFVFSVCLFLLLPYLVLFLGLGLLFGASILIQRPNLAAAETAIVMSEKTAATSKQGFTVLAGLPLGARFFGPGLDLSDILEKASNIGRHSVHLLRKGEGLSDNFFSGGSSGLPSLAEELTLELDYIYTELGFLQGDLSLLSMRLPYLLDWEKVSESISLVRAKMYHAKDVVSEIPWLLGDGKKRIYMVLFQNNMELRPTGGYIGSFALVGVENGRLAGIEVQDVFTADGQLKGHVEPPAPIKKYLGEAGWFLRDSNWDPEFSVSAQRAEWFLDKELGIGVDGVIALDLEAVKKILETTGEIELGDFSKTITAQNLFQETRQEIEENFFPGSRTKASFLTALSSSLLDKVSQPQGPSSLKLAKSISLGLEEKNIQIFLHNPRALRSIELLGWAGGLPSPQCGQTCFPDWVGLAEANLGVNKANFYIDRKVDFSVTLGEEQIDRTLTITWRNRAPKDIGEKGRYEAYIRVLGPASGKFGYGQKRIGQTTLGFSPDIENLRGHEEAGTIIEVFPQETSTVTFNWTTPAELSTLSGEYLLHIRKQAGTQADAWQININNSFGKNINGNPPFSLTGVNQFGYNTLLARDFVSRVWW